MKNKSNNELASLINKLININARITIVSRHLKVDIDEWADILSSNKAVPFGVKKGRIAPIYSDKLGEIAEIILNKVEEELQPLKIVYIELYKSKIYIVARDPLNISSVDYIYMDENYEVIEAPNKY